MKWTFFIDGYPILGYSEKALKVVVVDTVDIQIKYMLVSDERSFDVDNAAYFYFSFSNNN